MAKIFSWVLGKKEKPTIGLDIGSHTVKLVELSNGNEHRTVRRIGRAILPPESIVDGMIQNPAAIKEVIKGLIDNVRPKVKNASISISGYSVILKKIMVPFYNENEIEANLLFEAEKYVPFEIDDVYIDFHILNIFKDEGKGTELFLVAAKKEIVDSYAEIIKDIGLDPAVVDVDALALANSFEAALGINEENIILLDIGARKSNFNIISKGIPVFLRDMPIGGYQLTEAIQNATGLSTDESEKIKISGTEDKGLMKEIASICKETIIIWADEIKKALNFFNTNIPDKDRPKHLFLSGGTSLMKGLDKIIETEVSLPTRLFNPFHGYSIDSSIDPGFLQEIAPQLSIATGLALRTKS